MGRPTKYKEEYIGKVDEYLSLNQDEVKVIGEKFKTTLATVRLPTVEGFARFLDVNKTSLYEWEKKQPDFSNALEKIRIEQQQRLINQGLAGVYNSTIAKLILSTNHGMRENSDVTTGGEKLETIVYLPSKNGKANLETK